MSESTTNTNEVQKTDKKTGKKTGKKKPRKLLTPEEIFELEDKRAEKQKKMMKSVRTQKTNAKKRKNEAIVMKLAEKFNVEVKDIDLNFLEKLLLEDDVKNSTNQGQANEKQGDAILTAMAEKFNVKVENINSDFIAKLSFGDVVKISVKDEENLRIGQTVSDYLLQQSISVKDFLQEVSLWKDAYDVLSAQLREYAKQHNDEYGRLHYKFTQEMIPRLQAFLKSQDTNGNNAGYYSKAMKPK